MWKVIGILLAAGLAVVLFVTLPVVVVPLLLALFPATLLAPASRRLQLAGVPAALAAALLVFATLTGLTILVAFAVPMMVAELPALARSLAEAIRDFQGVVRGTPMGLRLEGLDPLVAMAETVLQPAGGTPAGAEPLDGGAFQAVAVAAEVVTGALLGFVALFFYLKDGPAIAAGVRDALPPGARRHADEIGRRVWRTLAGYVRGQLTVAIVDAVFIGIGLVLLGVPLALPLTVLVLLGGLLPIVGAVASGAVAVLVALADGGIGIALAVLALVLVVQQVESNVLQPVILGRATRLHPLLVVVVIAAGALVFGVLGAFLAVPVTACVARALDYVRERAPQVQPVGA